MIRIPVVELRQPGDFGYRPEGGDHTHVVYTRQEAEAIEAFLTAVEDRGLSSSPARKALIALYAIRDALRSTERGAS